MYVPLTMFVEQVAIQYLFKLRDLRKEQYCLPLSKERRRGTSGNVW